MSNLQGRQIVASLVSLRGGKLDKSSYPAVVGIEDSYRGEAPKAFIRLKPGHTATSEDIMTHLAPKLSKIELPSEIEFRAELPKSMIGKLSKKELKAEEQAKRTKP